MSGFTIVGNCKKCGAPIYAPTVWNGICPPPSQYSCSCFSEQGTGQYTNTAGTGGSPQ